MKLITCPECGREFAAWAKETWKDGVCYNCHSPLKRANKIMDENPFRQENFGWIQWKGTDVCMDVHCKKCAENYHWFGHIDASFVYFIKCACGTVYACDPSIRLVELTPEEATDVLTNKSSCHELSYNEDDE